MVYAPATRTVAQVMASVKRTFGDESGVQLADTDIITWINDGQDMITNKAKVLKAKATTPTIVGTSSYSFTTQNVHLIDNVHYNGNPMQNLPFAQAEQTYINSVSATETGDPSVWWEWNGTITLWPTPATVGTLTLYYTARPVRVTSSTDILGVPDKYYPLLLMYVLQQAYELDEDWQASQAKGTQFENALNELDEEERSAQHMTFDVVTIVQF